MEKRFSEDHAAACCYIEAVLHALKGGGGGSWSKIGGQSQLEGTLFITFQTWSYNMVIRNNVIK